MGTISSGVGLVSGINSGQIIEQLIALDSRPRTQLQTRIAQNNQVKLAYTDLQARLNALLVSANTLVRPSTFQSANATSSNSDVLGVSVSPNAAAGQYSFTVARTVTTQSMVSNGYADAATSLVGAGTVRIGLGGGEVTSSPALSDLNGGSGVRRGQFRVTDRSGQSAVVDIASAVNLDDVIKRINTASNIQVKASMGTDGLVLQDLSGGTGQLKIDDLQGGNAATDLGIRSAVSANTLNGTTINGIGRNTLLSSLNDGLGVRTKAGTDFRVTLGDGSTRDIDIGSPRTIGELIDSLNTQSGGKFAASIAPSGRGLRIVDTSGGTDPMSFSTLSDSRALADLGLSDASGTGAVNGRSLRSDLGSVLLRSLKGGSTNVTPGVVELWDRAGNSAQVDLSAADSLGDVIRGINNAGLQLSASINKSGTGIQIEDTSSIPTDSLDILVTDVSGNLATALGIEGTFSPRSKDFGPIDRQFVGDNTLLSTLNGGKGISSGKFRVTNSKGVSTEIDTSSLGSTARVSDLITMINAKNIGVTASVNAKGSGLLLTDTAAGTARMRVEDLSGTAASDLRLAGTATGTTLEGVYGATITTTATDTLNSLMTKINDANAGVRATVINDGTAGAPFRLSLTATGSGLDGRFTFDAGATSLSLDPLVRAQNAAVFLGGIGSANAVLVSSSSNAINNVIPGVTLNLNQASDQAVTVSVSQSPDTAVSTLKSFVKGFNDLTAKIGELTSFDTATNRKGLLLGDATANSVTDSLFQAVSGAVRGAGRYSLFAQVGVTIGADNQLNFDESRFRSAWSADPQAAQRLFTAFNTVTKTTTTNAGGAVISDTTTTTPFGTTPVGTALTTDGPNRVKAVTTLEGFGLGYLLQKQINKLVDPANGTLIQQSKSIDSANEAFQDRIASLTTLLDAKKLRLQKQFANMETVLSQLQTQQSALGRIQSISAPSAPR